MNNEKLQQDMDSLNFESIKLSYNFKITFGLISYQDHLNTSTLVEFYPFKPFAWFGLLSDTFTLS